MTYDYIIIGAGSAGCILANRLSANPENSVLLIEAGGRDWKPEIHIPGAYPKLHKSVVDWGYWSEPQEHLLGRKLYMPRGKTLGGCSSTNAMAYVRGNKEDFNDWANEGNKGWSYDEILPYFKRSEHNEDHDDNYHGQSGELNVAFAKRFQTPFAEAFIEASVEKGFERNSDYNGAKQKGAGLFQFNIKNGSRHSAAVAFLRPAMKRPNLKVLTGIFTKKVVVKNDKAVGVIVGKSHNHATTFKANKEVILSAGAFGSPQLLMLSGIGDQEELSQNGIECIRNLKGVGKNLQDHLFYNVSALSNQQEGQNHHIKLMNQGVDLMKWLFKKTGALTASPLESVAFGSTQASPDRVDLQLHFTAFHIGTGYDVDFYDLSTFPTEQDGFTILPTLLKPKSRGFLKLRSKNPFEHPMIQPNFLSEEADKKVLIEGGKLALEVLQANAFDIFRKEIIAPVDSSSDDAWLTHIQKVVETVYHPVGTCKMGNDEMAVVDDHLRVKGIEGLRVIDASIMPTITSGNTNAPVYMIAEKGADMILGKQTQTTKAKVSDVYLNK